MEVTRARFHSLLEWALAALCVLVLAGLGSWLLRQARTSSVPVVPVAAEETHGSPPVPPLTPAVVPSKAVSVPFLLLRTGAEVRVGDTESSASEKLPAAWRLSGDLLERVAQGERVTRAYDDGVRHFTLVFDPPAPGSGERHITALYVS